MDLEKKFHSPPQPLKHTANSIHFKADDLPLKKGKKERTAGSLQKLEGRCRSSYLGWDSRYSRAWTV